MYRSRRRLTYVKSGLPFYLWLLTHLFVLDTPAWTDITIGDGKSPSGWLRTNTMRISLLPGTPPAALSLRKYHYPLCLLSPPPIASRIHSYKFYRSLPCGRSWRTYEIGFAHSKTDTSNVLDEWVFNFQRSLVLLHLMGLEKVLRMLCIVKSSSPDSVSDNFSSKAACPEFKYFIPM